MEQLALFGEAMVLRRDLPCANPGLVDAYVAIEEILQTARSCDFEPCDYCEIALCEHNLNDKRQDDSYKVLVQHFRDGGPVNFPIMYEDGYQSNGHHRLTAALDAGFTHVPTTTSSLWSDDWSDTPVEKYGFRLCYHGAAVEEIPESRPTWGKD